jgi:hypothetical protein
MALSSARPSLVRPERTLSPEPRRSKIRPFPWVHRPCKSRQFSRDHVKLFAGFLDRLSTEPYRKEISREIVSSSSSVRHPCPRYDPDIEAEAKVDSVSKIRKNLLLQHRCLSSTSTEQDSLLRGSGPSSHQQPSSQNCRRQSSAPSSSLLDNSDCANKTERFANECEYICSRSSVPCRESA